mgnify:CR=1 FL=1
MAKEKASKINGIPVYCSYDRPVDLVDLVEHPSNPNKHGDKQIALLSKIIRNQGWRNPVIVSKRSGFIVAGHGRLAAAKLLNVEAVPVDYQDFANEAEEHAHLIADNRIAELAEIDSNELAGLLRDLEGKIDLDLTGFDEVSLDDILTATEPEAAEVDAEPQIDKAEELQAKWKTELGQVWKLGDHRLLCGDAVDSINNFNDIDAIVSDPPYGMNFDASWYGGETSFGTTVDSPTKKEGKVEWDSKPFDPSHLFGKSKNIALFGANFYCTRLLEDGTWWVWDKHITENGETPNWYGMPFELIWFNGKRGHKIVRHLWAGFTRKKTEQDKTRFHPTQKPIGVMREVVEYVTDKKQTVLDPYNGSGTTLMACLSCDRKYIGIEIEPKYVAVTIQRWADATGREPKLCS